MADLGAVRPRADERGVSPLPDLAFDWPRGAELHELLEREWLGTNGLGGYASSTLAGCNTRRYHGLFVPSLPVFGRTVLVPKLEEHVVVGRERFRLDGEETADGLDCPATHWIRSFHLEGLVPRWEYALGDTRLGRRVVMLHGENTLFVEYAHLAGPDLALTLRPWSAFRFHDRALPAAPARALVRLSEDRVEFSLAEDPPPLHVRVAANGAVPFIGLAAQSRELVYRIEKRRGLDHRERLR